MTPSGHLDLADWATDHPVAHRTIRVLVSVGTDSPGAFQR